MRKKNPKTLAPITIDPGILKKYYWHEKNRRKKLEISSKIQNSSVKKIFSVKINVCAPDHK